MAALVIFFLFLVLTGPSELLWAHTSAAGINAAEWHWRVDVLLVLSSFATVYVRGWLRLRRHNVRAVQSWQLGLYLVGLAAIGVALLSPIDALASVFLSMHMVQHLLLLMISPILLLLANPFVHCLWGVPRKLRHGIGRLFVPRSVFRSAIWALTLMPATWSLYVLDLWAWHSPALYQLALRQPGVHDAEHISFFVTAFFFWWPIVNPSPRLHGQISYGYRIIYLVAATLQNTLLGMAISIPERVLYPFYATVPQLRAIAPIDDQALGGGIMWVSGHMYLIPILVLVARLLKQEETTLNRSSPDEILTRPHS
jgi:cytochrome c oxidase assembly factor CtaG